MGYVFGTATLYTVINYHKCYSVAYAVNALDHKLLEKRIDYNAPEAFAAFFQGTASPQEQAKKALTFIFSAAATPGMIQASQAVDIGWSGERRGAS